MNMVYLILIFLNQLLKVYNISDYLNLFFILCNL